MTPIWMLLLSAAAGLLWLDALKARERALALARAHCERQGVQLLDDTVALVRLRPAWRSGRLRWRRHYGFEFADGSDWRRHGVIVFLGPDLEGLEMEPHR
jgi:hypothetical protein